jgi:hydroxymethylbilane synthase
LKHARPDLELITLRGNVDTRLRKLDENHYDAIILAAAGLIRLGLESRITEYFAPDQSLPAVGQGIIGIECRDDDARNIAYVRALNDSEAWQCASAERAFAQRLEGSCQSPIAGFATLNGDRLQLHGVIGSPDGREMYRGSQHGAIADAEAIGVRLADALLKDGADQLLERLRQESP